MSGWYLALRNDSNEWANIPVELNSFLKNSTTQALGIFTEFTEWSSARLPIYL